MEGFIVLALCLYFYAYFQFNWIVFAVLLLAPDLSALGYLKNVKVGSVLYNIFHTYTIPLVIMIVCIWIQYDPVLMMSFIWIAHIGMDRMFGYGLKYPTTFQDTHLNRV